jgi:hypothetical protein
MQHGATGYGQAVVLVEITDLSEQAYEERELVTLAPSAKWPGQSGFHTLSGTDRSTLVDVCTDARSAKAGFHRALGKARSIVQKRRANGRPDPKGRASGPRTAQAKPVGAISSEGLL